MKTAGIIAEFNPFHNGHAYLIERAREEGYTHIVAVMSGNFVQRGEPAVFSNFSRVRTALENGVDLVLNLPLPYAVSGASGFAGGGVSILNATGVVDSLVFGSECGDTGILEKTAEILADKETDALISEELKKGITYAAARENVLRVRCPGCAGVIRDPNNILAVEYISALKSLNSHIEPVTFRRKGPAHDSGNTSDNIASASEIRRLIYSGEEWKRFVPLCDSYNESQNIRPVDLNKFESLVLYKMRTMTDEERKKLPDISEGIENRIAVAAKQAGTLDELYSLAKTKRYTHARIRRIVLSSVLGITSDDVTSSPGFIRVLGFNDRGAELIRKMKTDSALPVVTKAADFSSLDDACRRTFELECRGGDIYALMTDGCMKCGSEINSKVMILK